MADAAGSRSLGSTLYTGFKEFLGAVQFLLFIAALIIYTPLLSALASKLIPARLGHTLSSAASSDAAAPEEPVVWVDYVDQAIPFFVVSIITEMVVSRWKEAEKKR